MHFIPFPAAPSEADWEITYHSSEGISFFNIICGNSIFSAQEADSAGHFPEVSLERTAEETSRTSNTSAVEQQGLLILQGCKSCARGGSAALVCSQRKVLGTILELTLGREITTTESWLFVSVFYGGVWLLGLCCLGSTQLQCNSSFSLDFVDRSPNVRSIPVSIATFVS